MAEPIEEIRLFFQEGSSDKVYHAEIVEDDGKYTVKVAWGRRGGNLNEGNKAVRVTLDAARKKFASLVREKTNKGYQEHTAAIAPAAVAPPMGEGSGSRVTGTRPTVGLAAQLLTALDDGELARALADDRMIAQQKVDGQRVIAHVGSEILTTNRTGQKTAIRGEVVAGLEMLPDGTIVDGEVVGDGSGQAYWLFDVLAIGGDDVRHLGFLERWTLLSQDLEPALSGDIGVLPVFASKPAKSELYGRLQQAKAEGIVFKDRDAPYTPGRPSSGGTQRKYKFVRSADVVILENAGNAYLMAVYDGKKLFEVGRVFAGTTNDSRRDLDALLAAGQTPVAEVRYLYATADRQLFQPVFVSLRTDKLGAACGADQLVGTDRRVLT